MLFLYSKFLRLSNNPTTARSTTDLKKVIFWFFQHILQNTWWGTPSKELLLQLGHVVKYFSIRLYRLCGISAHSSIASKFDLLNRCYKKTNVSTSLTFLPLRRFSSKVLIGKPLFQNKWVLIFSQEKDIQIKQGKWKKTFDNLHV